MNCIPSNTGKHPSPDVCNVIVNGGLRTRTVLASRGTVWEGMGNLHSIVTGIKEANALLQLTFRPQITQVKGFTQPPNTGYSAF